MYDFVKNNLPHSFYDVVDVVRNTRDVQNIHRTSQSDMIHVYRCHTKCSSRLPLYTLPIIWNKWPSLLLVISLDVDCLNQRHVKSTICLFSGERLDEKIIIAEIVDNYFHFHLCSCLYLTLCPIFRCLIGCILHKSYCS